MKKFLLSLITSLVIICLFIIVSQDTVFALIKEFTAPERLFESLDAKIIQATNKSQMIEVSKDQREEVTKKLLDAGYKEIDVEKVENANYKTDVLIKLDRIVTLQEADKKLRVIWADFDKDYLDLLYQTDTTDTGEVIMAQVGIDRGSVQKMPDNPMIGMCYVYKLSDGSVVVIDGGWPTEECADNLYNTLIKLNTARDDEGKLKIAAWVFTHGHSDHTGTFASFAFKYSESTSISYMLYNLPSEYVDDPELNCDVDSFEKIASVMYPNAVHIEPRAGLKYHFGNLTIDMLYTPEMLYDAEKNIEYYNNTSLIFTVECCGTRVLHFGDSGEYAARMLWDSYDEEAFESDAVQISHHGLNTGLGSHDWEHLGYIYEATKATIGLLPLGTRNEDEERNGRYTVLVEWTLNGYQIEFVTKENNRHGLKEITQEYYEQFVRSVADGTSQFSTLFGYNGINTVVNEDGMTTYLSSTETENMITLFTLNENGMTMVGNCPLKDWLSAE